METLAASMCHELPTGGGGGGSASGTEDAAAVEAMRDGLSSAKVRYCAKSLPYPNFTY